MKFFCLRITTAARQKKRLDAERGRRIKDNVLIARLMAEKVYLQSSAQKLVSIAKSRQQSRKFNRQMAKN